MQKTILITGSTDGIGLATARKLAEQGHRVLLHGRSESRLAAAEKQVADIEANAMAGSYVADLSNLSAVETLARSIAAEHESLDVLINNAGVFRTSSPINAEGMDVRFVVNTLAPYLLTTKLLPLMNSAGRIVNLSSAAQSPVDADALAGKHHLADEFAAYAQSKLAITMWSRSLAETLGAEGPVVVAVNPGSLLGSKMVQEGFGVAGGDISIGADILIRAALGDEFADASGKYFDNDAGRFGAPHPDAQDLNKCQTLTAVVESLLG